MATIKQTTQTKNIIASGSVFTFNLEPFILEFDTEPITLRNTPPNNSRLVIQFHFVENKEKGRSIDGTPSDDGQYFKIEIYNAKGIGGTSTPLLIAEDDLTRKKTYLSLSFQETGDSFLCNYTIFLEK